MRLAAVLAAAVLAALPAGTAMADQAAGVLYTRDVQVVPLDYGYVVQVVCNATADPGTTSHLAVATAVSCSLGGVTRTRAMPGSEAIVTNAYAAVGPLEFCIWGEAAFVDPLSGEAFTVEGTPKCEVLDFG
jgi:hypothetical protein